MELVVSGIDEIEIGKDGELTCTATEIKPAPVLSWTVIQVHIG